MLRVTLATSKSFNSLSTYSKLLFLMIIPHLDGYGKMNGFIGYIKSVVCPLAHELTDEIIGKCLSEISQKTHLKWFKRDDLMFIHAIDWEDHQSIESEKRGQNSLPNFNEVGDQVAHQVGDQVEPQVEVEVEVEVEGEVKDMRTKTVRPLTLKPENPKKITIKTEKNKNENGSAQKTEPEKSDLWGHLLAHISTRWEKEKGIKMLFTGSHLKWLQLASRHYGHEGIMALWDMWFEHNTEWAEWAGKCGRSLEGFSKALPRLLDDSRWKMKRLEYQKKFSSDPVSQSNFLLQLAKSKNMIS